MSEFSVFNSKHEDKGQGDRLVARKAQRQKELHISSNASIVSEKKDRTSSSATVLQDVPNTRETEENTHEEHEAQESKQTDESNDDYDENEIIYTQTAPSGSFFEKRNAWAPTFTPESVAVQLPRCPSPKLDRDVLSKLRIHESVLQGLEQEKNKMLKVQERRQQGRSKINETQKRREKLELSLGLMHTTTMGPKHLTREEVEKTLATSFSWERTKRWHAHPQHDEAYKAYIEKEKDLIVLRQLHRERQQELLRARKEMREQFEKEMKTPYATLKMRKSPQRKENISDQDRVALLELDVLQQKFKQNSLK